MRNEIGLYPGCKSVYDWPPSGGAATPATNDRALFKVIFICCVNLPADGLSGKYVPAFGRESPDFNLEHQAFQIIFRIPAPVHDIRGYKAVPVFQRDSGYINMHIGITGQLIFMAPVEVSKMNRDGLFHRVTHK